MVKPTLVVWLGLWTASCGSDPVPIPEGAVPFDGTGATLPTADLAPLWDLVGDARFIGLGESVHTSGGFYAAKHRLIRALIEEHGVRAVAIESPRNRARALDAYLNGGDCDRPAREALASHIFEVFSDQNTYQLMRWICERNAAAPSDPVRLFGFDMQQSDEDAVEIQGFLDDWAPDDAAALLAGIETCEVNFALVPPPEEKHEPCMEGLDALEAWFGRKRADLVATAGERTVRLFELAELGFRASQIEYFLQERDLAGAYEARDVAMGAVFQGVLELDLPSDVRIAVWAHNYHLAMRHERVEVSQWGPSKRTFGTVLTEVFGADYAAVAITGYAPGTNWPQVEWVTDHSYLGTSRGSVESDLHEFGEPYLIVDPGAEFLRPGVERVFSEEVMILRDQFTAVVYLDESPKMDAVFW
jgi:erythromycin esterase